MRRSRRSRSGGAPDAYLADLEAGRPADPHRLLAAPPAIAEPLRACLEVMHLADRMATGSDPGRTERSSTGMAPTPVRPADRPAHCTLGLGPGELPKVLLRDLPDDPEPWPARARPKCRGTAAGPRAATSFKARSPAAAWARSSRAATSTWAATWPSRCCSRHHRGNPELVRRFVEEAQIGGQLQHPGIVPVYELGTFPDRRPFFAMKLVKGRTLADCSADRPGPAARPAALPGHLRGSLPDDGLRPRTRRDPPRPEALERDGRLASARCR